MATRAALSDIVAIDLVAFPQSGLLICPGTVELMEQALRLGAETVGGLDPCAIDRDPKGHLDAVFGMAERFGRNVDIHLHEPGEMGVFSMELIIERVRALGMAGRVIVSHAFCLGMPDPSIIDPLVEATRGCRDRHHDNCSGFSPCTGGQAVDQRWCRRMRGIRWHSRHMGPVWKCRHAGTGDVRRLAQ